ncbi:MAG: hypothetical protein H0U00_11010 [Actinobacteria bacterium]|nr:hypothetical protein [Actinomycetota bacterium]
MSTYSDLREHVLDTLWSQWHELGVAATVPRRHSDDVIDPEPLIAFTAAHADLDPRLRDESIDWVLRYGTYVSKARLKNVLTAWELLDEPLFREYAATVNAHGGAGWPAARVKPLAFRSRGRSLLEDLSRPALLSLRIRAVFGVGARAELIRAFLTHPGSSLTAADLSAETSYGKRNVLNELEPLRFAGVVNSFRAANADRFSLAMADQLAAVVGPLPRRSTAWTQTFGVLHLLLGVVRHGTKRSELQNAVDAVRLLEEGRSRFAAAQMYPPLLPSGPSAWPAFLDWAVGQAKAIARN